MQWARLLWEGKEIYYKGTGFSYGLIPGRKGKSFEKF